MPPPALKPIDAASIVLPPSIIFNRSGFGSALEDHLFADHAALADLRPTQVAVGLRAVEAKRRKIERRFSTKRKMRRFLEKRPVPVILGPDDDYYMIDHHHLCLALWQHEVDEVAIRVVSDLSDLPRRKFFRSMLALGWLHPFDPQGQRVCPTELPSSIDQLRADPYRDLAWSVRQAGGFKKAQIPFVEFAWAKYFRLNIPETLIIRDFDLAHDWALELARSDAARRLPGFVLKN
jgi:hypothetical protein